MLKAPFYSSQSSGLIKGDDFTTIFRLVAADKATTTSLQTPPPELLWQIILDDAYLCGAEFIRQLTTNPKAFQLMQKRKVRGGIAGYWFLILLQNCRAGETAIPDRFMRYCSGQDEPFDYSTEIQDHSRWYIQLSGSLYNDIRANYVAKVAATHNWAWCVQFLNILFETIIAQVDESIRTAAGVTAVLPWLPTLGELQDDPNCIVEILSTYTQPHPEKKKADCKGLLDRYSQYLFRTLDKPQAFRLFQDSQFWGARAMNSPNDKPTMGNTSILNLEMSEPSKATYGIDTSLLFSQTTVTALQDYPKSKSCPFSLAEQLHAFDAIHRNQLYDRERMEYQLTKKFFAQRDRSKEKMDNLISENAVLTAKLGECRNELSALRQEQKSATQYRAEDKISAKDVRIMNLENELSALRNASDKSTRHLAELMEEKEALQAENAALQRQVANKGTEQEITEAENIDTSIFDTKHIIIIGGHRSWVVGMQDLHPNITIIDAEGDCGTDTLRGADMIWFQTNALSHVMFFRTIHCVRTNNIPYRFFSFAGHRSCRMELVKETTAYFTSRRVKNG